MFALISPLCKGHHGDTFLLSLNLISSLISGRQQFIGKMYLKRQLSPPSQYQHFTEYTVQYLCTATVARYHRKCQCNYILKNISYKINSNYFEMWRTRFLQGCCIMKVWNYDWEQSNISLSAVEQNIMHLLLPVKKNKKTKNKPIFPNKKYF